MRYARSKNRPYDLRLDSPNLAFDSSAAPVLADSTALNQMQPGFLRTLAAELGTQALAAKVCPVLLSDHTVALFAVAGQVGSDQANALALLVQQHGYVLARPQRYVLPPALLLAIVRGQIGPHALLGSSESQAIKTDLARAFQDMVAWGVEHQASDLHINIFQNRPESEVRFTIGGHYLCPERFARIPTRTLSDMLAVAWMEISGGNGAVFDPNIEQQGSLLKQIDGRSVLLRWASLPADRGPSVCLRLLPRTEVSADLSLHNLGYLPDQVKAIESAAKISGGAIIFAGRVGSGKSTSLAALIARLPSWRKVITLEDPVEYLIPNAIQNTVSRQLDEPSHRAYAAKLKTLKRSGMHDVLLGEIRDVETGRAFMDLAGSGVSVYTTTHAPSAVAIADRLASDFIAVSRDFLATPGILKLLVYQVLIPRLCGHCALPLSLSSKTHESALRHVYQGAIQSLRMRNPHGCSQCRQPQLPQQNGFQGRTVAAEYIFPDQIPGLLWAIKQGRASHFWRLHACQKFVPSQVPMMGSSALHSALYKSLKGLIDPHDIERSFKPFEVLKKQLQSGQPRLAARGFARRRLP
ncbi:MAG TPA: ATPase, T2SS/T4P/T4SS family [Burkholderiaceae bacterium]|nr:ATPase, T2SS/T4P/T4SS family [Burkholderiaceae bacterium]